MSSGTQQKTLRQVLHDVAALNLPSRVCVLRMALHLTLQKLHDAEQWRAPQGEKENAQSTH